MNKVKETRYRLYFMGKMSKQQNAEFEQEMATSKRMQQEYTAFRALMNELILLDAPQEDSIAEDELLIDEIPDSTQGDAANDQEILDFIEASREAYSNAQLAAAREAQVSNHSAKIKPIKRRRLYFLSIAAGLLLLIFAGQQYYKSTKISEKQLATLTELNTDIATNWADSKVNVAGFTGNSRTSTHQEMMQAYTKGESLLAGEQSTSLLEAAGTNASERKEAAIIQIQLRLSSSEKEKWESGLALINEYYNPDALGDKNNQLLRWNKAVAYLLLGRKQEGHMLLETIANDNVHDNHQQEAAKVLAE